jgi:hypothetical protein
LKLFLFFLLGLFFLEDSGSFFGDFRQFLEDDLAEVFVLLHISEFFRPVELEDIRKNFVDESGRVDLFFFPISGGGRVVGHATGDFKEEGDVRMIFDEETEEVGEVDEALEFVHVVFEVFLAVGIFPVLNRLRPQPEDFVDSIQSAERVKNVHFGNVSEVLFARVVIRVFDGDVNNVIFVLDFFELSIWLGLDDAFDRDSC